VSCNDSHEFPKGAGLVSQEQLAPSFPFTIATRLLGVRYRKASCQDLRPGAGWRTVAARALHGSIQLHVALRELRNHPGGASPPRGTRLTNRLKHSADGLRPWQRVVVTAGAVHFECEQTRRHVVVEPLPLGAFIR
jgi:hypothetical protein